MASNQVMLVLFCGEIWSSLSAAAPQHAARTESHMGTTATSPGADKVPLHQLQATVPSLYQSDGPLATTEPQALPGEEEAGDGSWVAALMLGSILIGMMLAIMVILLWKCCLRPPLAESHWAGRSPFVDGDTSDLFMDAEPGTKRSSVLFMLPWRAKQGTNLQQDPAVPEIPPQHTTSAESGQPPPPAAGCPGAAPAPAPEPASSAAQPCPPAPASSAAQPCPPAPASSAAQPCPPAPACSAAQPCPPPDCPPECSDLPPPPAWLREPAEEASSDPSRHSALHLEAEEPQPPPELLTQEIHETPPQPEHPL